MSVIAETQSICPRCRIEVLDAELIERDGRVVLTRTCPEHGECSAVVYGDAARYAQIQRFAKPGESPRERQTDVVDGCPHDCGICPDHAQHTCLGIIEVNTACNLLDCPICFADSGTGVQEHGFSLTLGQVESMLDAFVRAEGEPESVQLSGGEPSIHPQILEMLAAARDRGIPLVMLNTNGIRLARDPRFAPALAELGVHVYLQFDGLQDSTYRAIQGRALAEEKQRALDRCAEAGVSVSLAAAVEREVNEHEIGAIVRMGVAHRAVTGVFFQPVTHSGRFRLDADPLHKLANYHSDRGDLRAAARVVPRRRLRPGAVLLADLPLSDVRPLRRRGSRPAAAPRRCRALPRLRHQPCRARSGRARGTGRAVVGQGGGRQRPGRRTTGVHRLRDGDAGAVARGRGART